MSKSQQCVYYLCNASRIIYCIYFCCSAHMNFLVFICNSTNTSLGWISVNVQWTVSQRFRLTYSVCVCVCVNLNVGNFPPQSDPLMTFLTWTDCGRKSREKRKSTGNTWENGKTKSHQRQHPPSFLLFLLEHWIKWAFKNGRTSLVTWDLRKHYLKQGAGATFSSNKWLLLPRHQTDTSCADRGREEEATCEPCPAASSLTDVLQPCVAFVRQLPSYLDSEARHFPSHLKNTWNHAKYMFWWC